LTGEKLLHPNEQGVRDGKEKTKFKKKSKKGRRNKNMAARTFTRISPFVQAGKRTVNVS
jgi:hypothetical protein